MLPVTSIENTALFSHLEDRYKEPVKELYREARDLSSRIPAFFPEYTLHDSIHHLRVAELAGMIVGDRVSLLRQDELVLLLLAACFHDIGMVCDEHEIERIRNERDFLVFQEEWRYSHPNLEELERMHRQDFISETERIRIGGKIAEMEKAMFSDFLRRQHPGMSKDYVLYHLTNHPSLGALAKDLGEICLSHGQSVDWIQNHPWMSASRKYVCYVLRLADLLDFDGDRTPDVLFRAISFSSPVSLREWEKHKGVKCWMVDEDNISFSMEYHHPAYEKAGRDFIEWIDQELEQVHIALDTLKIELPGYTIIRPVKVEANIQSIGYEYHDLSFSLSRDEIVKLFLTDNLYGEKSLFVRELLQNSLDAIRLRTAIKASRRVNWEDGQVWLRHYMDEQGRSVVECEDNGCGMDLEIIERYFGRVGRSYYRSNEFERLRAGLRLAGVDFDPCSRFGIGFMSVFMVADEVRVYTRKEYDDWVGDPFEIEINGLSNLFVIKKGAPNQPVGTKICLYERSAPPAFDKSSDNIKLVETVDSYAVACEFPIHAECLVPGIVDRIDVRAGVMTHETFLERVGVRRIKTYEVDFGHLDRCFSGRMRQSFLVDEKGHITLKNNEAEWQRANETKSGSREKQTVLKTRHYRHSFEPIIMSDSPYTVSCDGIAVTGVFGRRKQDGRIRKTDIHEPLMNNAGAPFVLDVRGSLKPELSPARTITEEIADSLPGVMNVRRVINKASSLLWEMVLKECSPEEMPAFWSYLFIYDTSFYREETSKMISKKVLIDKLALPVAGGEWWKMSEIESFEGEDDDVKVYDKRGTLRPIRFSNEIARWMSDRSAYLCYIGTVVPFLNRVSKLCLSETGDGRFVIDHTPVLGEGNMFCLKSEVIPFSGIEDRCILSLTPRAVYNEESPIVRVAAMAWRVRNKTPFELFSDDLCEKVFDYFIFALKSGQTPFKDVGVYFRYTGALFKALDRNKIDVAYLPPYYVQGLNGKKYEITEEMLLEWANAPAPKV